MNAGEHWNGQQLPVGSVVRVVLMNLPLHCVCLQRLLAWRCLGVLICADDLSVGRTLSILKERQFAQIIAKKPFKVDELFLVDVERNGEALWKVFLLQILLLFFKEIVRPQVQAHLIVLSQVPHIVLEYTLELFLHGYHLYDIPEVNPIFVLPKEVLSY